VVQKHVAAEVCTRVCNLIEWYVLRCTSLLLECGKFQVQAIMCK
jgi:hypothetical protein